MVVGGTRNSLCKVAMRTRVSAMHLHVKEASTRRQEVHEAREPTIDAVVPVLSLCIASWICFHTWHPSQEWLL
jgi:hypothetical protein